MSVADRTQFERLRQDPTFAAFRTVSARLGADPLHVQGPGGNTSLKRDGAMWVKASGARLADALDTEVMVPVQQAALRNAVDGGEAPAAIDFVPTDVAAPALRPSIETTVHAVFDAPVVLHTHCVETIAVAIRDDAEAVIEACLGDLDPVTVPYLMPGLPLARALLAADAPTRRVAILGNHGLVVAGETVEEAARLLTDVSARLAARRPAATEATGALHQAEGLAGKAYRPASHPSAHRVGQDPALLALARRGPFYPDHVVFLGADLTVADEGEDADGAGTRIAATTGTPPPLVLVPGIGAAVRRDAPAAVDEMARCLGDVLARVEPGAPVRPIPDAEVAALLGWDAEKHRHAMNAGQPAA